MILENIFNYFFNFIYWLLSFLPYNNTISTAISGFHSVQAVFMDLIDYGLVLLPVRCWNSFLIAVIGWSSVHLLWSIIEWIYKKIPGVN